MGAWGHGHLDNDSALDFLSFVLNTKVLKTLSKKKKLEPCEYDEVRAACALLVHLSQLEPLWVDIGVIEGLTKQLEKIHQDKEWISNWKNPKEVKKNVGVLLKKMKKLEGY